MRNALIKIAFEALNFAYCISYFGFFQCLLYCYIDVCVRGLLLHDTKSSFDIFKIFRVAKG